MINNLQYFQLESTTTRKKQAKLSTEQRFWRKFTTESYQTYTTPISCIASNRNARNLMALGHGIQLSLINPSTKQSIREISSFTNNVSAVCFRGDGLVMAVADEAGQIQVLDTKEKFNLRTFKNHKRKVNSLQFSSNNELYSGGEDMALRVFDIAAGTVFYSLDGAHQDYITSIRSLSEGTVITGGYDKKINLFDIRASTNPQLSFDHKFPVEAMDKFSTNLSFVACGGQKVSLWDLRFSEKPIVETYCSKKLVTSIKVASNNSRVMTGSYDNHFKVFRSDNLEVTYQEKFDKPITHFDLTNDQKNIVLGLVDGTVLIKGHNKSFNEANKTQQKTNLQAGDSESQKEIEDEIALWMKNNEKSGTTLNDKYFYRGIYGKTDSFDLKFERARVKKLNKYDKYLKKFQYKEALLDSLQKNFGTFESLVDEYIQRGCLDRTIKSLKRDEVERVIGILGKHLQNPHHAKTSLMLLDAIIKYHSQQGVRWNELYAQCEKEKQIMNELWQLDGMLETIESLTF